MGGRLPCTDSFFDCFLHDLARMGPALFFDDSCLLDIWSRCVLHLKLCMTVSTATARTVAAESRHRLDSYG